MSSLLSLLRCPLCRDQLANPTTLHCGHSLCSVHLEAATASCPVPGCSNRPEASSPRIPHGSSVHYSAAPLAAVPITTSRSDVVLNKIIPLVQRAAAEEPDDSSPRPRKRQRHRSDDSDDDDNDLLSHLRSAAARTRETAPDRPLDAPSPEDQDALSDFDKKLLDELTCHICYVLFYQPVTTPCQHTFCARCLQRSIDHSPVCPICRQDLPSLYFQDQPVNKTLLAIILQAFPLLYQERRAAIEEEARHERLNTPIFVCNLSFPGMPTMLHIFEPRYRLMLRRCLESSNPHFGMVMSPKPGAPQTDYGTLLEIRKVQMLPDGRSMVETWGTTRFRILERGTLDGYMVARIERIYDDPEDLGDPLESDEPSSPVTRPTVNGTTSTRAESSSSANGTGSQPTNEELMETCKTFLDRLQRGAAPWVVQRLSTQYGQMPRDTAAFSFWVALVLPIEEHEKAKLLPIRSPRLRLMLVVHWIEQLNNNWYAWLRCFVLAPIAGWLLEGPALLLPLLLLLVFCGNYLGYLPLST